LFPHLSVQGNLVYGQRRIDRAQQRISLDDAVALLDIGHLMARRPDRLSGGERQRVAMARALLTSPRLLLMDEPLSALDAQRKAEILPYLEQLNAQTRVPMVYVTHALDEAARLADHLVLMEAGKVRASGPASDVFSRLDLPLSQLDEAAAVLDAVVASHDPAYGLSRLEVGTQSLWVGQTTVAVGQRVRVRVMARDVSVTLSRASDSSILNILPVLIDSVRDDGLGRMTLGLRLVDAGNADGASGRLLLARVTRRSYDALQLSVGLRVHAQIKGAALMTPA
jgi:molybdate transport system ATP-binding protein